MLLSELTRNDLQSVGFEFDDYLKTPIRASKKDDLVKAIEKAFESLNTEDQKTIDRLLRKKYQLNITGTKPVPAPASKAKEPGEGIKRWELIEAIGIVDMAPSKGIVMPTIIVDPTPEDLTSYKHFKITREAVDKYRKKGFLIITRNDSQL